MAVRERYRRRLADRKGGFSRRERGDTTRNLNLRDMGLILREDPYSDDGVIGDRAFNTITGDIFIKTPQGWRLIAQTGAPSGNEGQIRGGGARDYGLFGVVAFWGADENIFMRTENRYWQWDELPQALDYGLEGVVAFWGADENIFMTIGAHYYQWDSLQPPIDYGLEGVVAFFGNDENIFLTVGDHYFQWDSLPP